MCGSSRPCEKPGVVCVTDVCEDAGLPGERQRCGEDNPTDMTDLGHCPWFDHGSGQWMSSSVNCHRHLRVKLFPFHLSHLSYNVLSPSHTQTHMHTHTLLHKSGSTSHKRDSNDKTLL